MTQATISGRSVLLVEDDDELRGVLGRGLREEGFSVDSAATGANALEAVERSVPDVLVIDIGLPDADGRDLCQALRARGVQTPVLFLTARDAVVDRISGFDAGGDDYLAKPFAFVELVARLQALLRRSGSDGALESGGLRLDPLTHSLGDGTNDVPLTPTEFRLLAKLFAASGAGGAAPRPRPGRLAARRDRPREHARLVRRPAAAQAQAVRAGARDLHRARRGIPTRMTLGIRRRLLLVVIAAVVVSVAGLVAGFNLVLGRQPRPRLPRPRPLARRGGAQLGRRSRTAA